jgi:hypothetical protein
MQCVYSNSSLISFFPLQAPLSSFVGALIRKIGNAEFISFFQFRAPLLIDDHFSFPHRRTHLFFPRRTLLSRPKVPSTRGAITFPRPCSRIFHRLESLFSRRGTLFLFPSSSGRNWVLVGLDAPLSFFAKTAYCGFHQTRIISKSFAKSLAISSSCPACNYENLAPIRLQSRDQHILQWNLFFRIVPTDPWENVRIFRFESTISWIDFSSLLAKKHTLRTVFPSLKSHPAPTLAFAC